MHELYSVIGFAYPKPGRATDLKEILTSFVEPTRQEEGCLEYHFHQDGPDAFAFYEVWRSKEDLDRHLALPHMKAFWESRMDYLERDLEIHFVTMLSPYPRATT
ncbi:putative quinol monooxygenase [Streptosporangium lutulentum]|uniref:Quinol monooxygenase YgiN n=1 Tax=Streptosporangium lutulentum TaxID=1461250 RepID=A0ABT9Q8D2_9ACTN|nr:putative quinol monooxygenase [Streptosporangium lutulentum]MDP9843011.1 quinol monooxygenase YgiN [Streptosporangium lutulentum]